MREYAEDVKANARSFGKDIIGEKQAALAEQEAAETSATVGALVEVFLAERELLTRRVRNGKTVTPTLRLRTHEASERFLRTYFAPLHHLVVGTVTRGAQVGVVDIDKRWTPISAGHKVAAVARSQSWDVAIGKTPPRFAITSVGANPPLVY